MKHSLGRRIVVSASTTLLFSQLSYAAAFQFYELGTPINGTAAVGQASVAADASTSYFNPAGMMQLQSTQFMLGPQLMLSYTNFSPNTSNTTGGGNGGSAGGLVAGADGYFVYNLSPKWKWGASLTMPYGGALSYNNHWVGRYNVQQMMLYTLNFNPAVAYQINDWAAVGGGVSVEYANLYQTVALPISSTEDGQATLKVDNTSPGFNLGLLLTPHTSTKIGVAFRSQIIHDLRGDLSFMNTTEAPGAMTKLVMPANVIASLSQRVTDRFALLGEAGWANWSTMVNTIISVNQYAAVVPQNWHDTYRLGLGGQYKITDNTQLQAGASYDSSPTSSSKRSPALPMDRQIRLGFGADIAIQTAVNLGLSYEYINLGKASINNTSAAGVLAGNYGRNYVNVVQASLNIAC